MPHIVLSNRALRDLDRLQMFLEEKSDGAARRAILAIRKQIPLLLSQPRLGRPLPDRPGLREWKIRFGRGAFRVFYMQEGDAVLILSVQHSREEERAIEVAQGEGI